MESHFLSARTYIPLFSVLTLMHTGMAPGSASLLKVLTFIGIIVR